MAIELLVRWLKMIKIIFRFKPDIAMSVTGISTALPSFLFKIPNIVFTDTETAELSNRISFPFADRIITPEWFTRDFGKKHHHYSGFHEWSYLHPDEFTPDPKILRKEGINPDQPYCVVRFVRWDALHDQGETGLTSIEAKQLVQQLAVRMQVCLSSEIEPPAELKKYIIRIRADRMHHLIAFSRLVVGESPSMCAEASLLGVPSVLISSWAGKCGNMQVLQNRFRLMQVFSNGSQAVQAAVTLSENLPGKDEIKQKRLALIHELEHMQDVVEYHINALVKHHHV